MANFKVDALEAKGSTLRKELIAAMDCGNRMKKQIKTLTNELKAEKLLTERKDEQLQIARSFRSWGQGGAGFPAY